MARFEVDIRYRILEGPLGASCGDSVLQTHFILRQWKNFNHFGLPFFGSL